MTELQSVMDAILDTLDKYMVMETGDILTVSLSDEGYKYELDIAKGHTN